MTSLANRQAPRSDWLPFVLAFHVVFPDPVTCPCRISDLLPGSSIVSVENAALAEDNKVLLIAKLLPPSLTLAQQCRTLFLLAHKRSPPSRCSASFATCQAQSLRVHWNRIEYPFSDIDGGHASPALTPRTLLRKCSKCKIALYCASLFFQRFPVRPIYYLHAMRRAPTARERTGSGTSLSAPSTPPCVPRPLMPKSLRPPAHRPPSSHRERRSLGVSRRGQTIIAPYSIIPSSTRSNSPSPEDVNAPSRTSYFYSSLRRRITEEAQEAVSRRPGGGDEVEVSPGPRKRVHREVNRHGEGDEGGVARE